MQLYAISLAVECSLLWFYYVAREVSTEVPFN
jgi:hypothetical protein